MSDSQVNNSVQGVREKISSWLQRRLNNESYQWLIEQSDQLWEGGEDWMFFTSFSKVPRFSGKANLELSQQEEQEAESIRPRWKPQFWSADELSRVLILLSIANRGQEEFLNLLQKVHETSDVGEAEALYKSLPVLPYPDQLQKRAAEGIRTNMTSVFNAVAHHNPYPADFLSEDAWNQMVLKALFVETPLYLISGIDERANETLADMLVDYAHERWAANREVSPELWRGVGPFAEDEVLDDLERVLAHPDSVHKQAGMLALLESPSDRAGELVKQHEKIKKEVEENSISWKTIGQQVNQ